MPLMFSGHKTIYAQSDLQIERIAKISFSGRMKAQNTAEVAYLALSITRCLSDLGSPGVQVVLPLQELQRMQP